MSTQEPQLAISRVLDAPRALVFEAFTDPEHLASWWGPSGHALAREAHLAGPSSAGWLESLEKLERVLDRVLTGSSRAAV